MPFLTTISLITAFAGGMVALFAPCCITYLLPSYLANIFREKTKVVSMTLLFGLGIATILVPTALGIRAVGQIFTQFHTQTYVVGGIFMILLGAMELTGRKITLPMIHLTIDLNKRHDPWSIYLLGVFSGITTSCCTPVLAGILTLSFLSPTFFWAALAGLAYVAGMVTPLVILGLLLERVNWSKLPQFRGKTVSLGTKKILLTDAIAGIIFILVGITFSILALTGRIAMGDQQSIQTMMGTNFYTVVRIIRAIPGSEFIFGLFLITILIVLVKKGGKS